MPAVADPQALFEIALFRGLQQSELEIINQKLRRHQFPAGTAIITAETPGEAVYLIHTGTVKIKVDQSDGKEVIIAILGPGNVVGEMSVIDSAGRSADVVTQEDSVLFWLDRSSFNQFVDTMPTLARNLLTVLTSRLRVAVEQIQALCTLDVYGMVARQLIAFADAYGEESPDAGRLIPLRLTQSDIAGMVGASRERVNQVFVQLRESKYINVDQHYRITLYKLDKLRDIVRQR